MASPMTRHLTRLQNGRRLLQSSNLVQAGVQLTSNVQTTQQLASSVGQSIDQALQNNQIAQVMRLAAAVSGVISSWAPLVHVLGAST